jgi:hypothetical protein
MRRSLEAGTTFPLRRLGAHTSLGRSDEIHVLPGGHFLHLHQLDEFKALALSWLGKWRT